MACRSCEDRREMGRRIVEAARNKNFHAMRKGLGQMAESMIKSPPKFRVRPEVAKNYGLDRRKG